MKRLICVLILSLITISIFAVNRDVFYNKQNGRVFMITKVNDWVPFAKTGWMNSEPTKNGVITMDTAVPTQQLWHTVWNGYQGTVWYVNSLTNPTSVTTTPLVP